MFTTTKKQFINHRNIQIERYTNIESENYETFYVEWQELHGIKNAQTHTHVYGHNANISFFSKTKKNITSSLNDDNDNDDDNGQWLQSSRIRKL